MLGQARAVGPRGGERGKNAGMASARFWQVLLVVAVAAGIANAFVGRWMAVAGMVFLAVACLLGFRLAERQSDGPTVDS